MNIKRNCIFLLDKEKDKPDAKLRYRIRWGTNIVAFNIGYRVDIDRWNTDSQRCKNNTTHGKKKVHSSVINREIQRFEDISEEVFYFFEQQNVIPSPEEFRKEMNTRLGRVVEKEKNFFDCYNEFIITEGKDKSWTEATYKKHRTIKKHLQNFAPNLEFADLTEKGLGMFVDYLLSLSNGEGNTTMKNSTIKKDINIMKWFLRWATRNNYNQELSYITFKPKLKTIPKKVIFLDWEELMQIYNTPIPESKSYLQRVKDKFLFCCFTSLRYSDMENLKWTNIYDEYIEITSIKTNDPLKIELNDYSKEILNKYEKCNEKVFPAISNQKMNDYLKELCSLCGLDSPVTITYYKGSERIDETIPKYQLITTHAGRRTFICNALMLGISPNIVMKWTGHSDYNAMKPYIEIADKAKKKAMSLFNK